MTGTDQPEPLWASSLADQTRPDYDDVIVRVLEEEAEEAPPAPAGDQQPLGRRPLVIGIVAATAAFVLAIALEREGSMTIAEVPSYWEDVPMTCHTVRLEEDERAIEMFRCRAVGGRSLPPGLYRTPDARWMSDITRRAARASQIRISPDGDVTGWATY